MPLLAPLAWAISKTVELLSEAAEIGIIFLLFLLGLDMQPSALLAVLKKATNVTLISSAVFAIVGAGCSYIWGFSLAESLIIGAAMMSSSTIIGIKLLPTTVLHHRHSGELMVGLLLLQDFLAIFVLILLLSGETASIDFLVFGKAIIAVPLLTAAAFFVHTKTVIARISPI